MLSKLALLMYLAPLVYLLMKHISIVTNASGVRWGQDIELCSNLQTLPFSRDRKVDAVQSCIINVSLDEQHSDGNSYPQGWGGVKKWDYVLNYKMFHFQGIERLMLTRLASLMYLWMNDILMVTQIPRCGVEK